MTELVCEADWKIRSDGRSVRGRIVPYQEPAMVFENGERYREQFLPGCLTLMSQIAHKRGNAGWISFNIDHDESMDARIGYAVSLEQLDDGGWCDFRLYNGAQLDKVRSMLEESHRGLSVMFDDVVAPKVIDGVRSRVQIKIAHVAATPMPVYDGALITAIRDVTGSEAPTVDELEDRPALAEWQQYLESLEVTT